MLKTRNRKIGLLALLLAVVLAFTVLPEIPRLTLATDEAEVIASGECGDDATWTLDEDGVLTISGTGEMEDYSPYTSPWYDYRTSITKTIVESGITHIGNASFCNSYMTEISLPDGLESIGEYAFTGSKLISLEIPKSVTELGVNVAYTCKSLGSVKLPSGLESIPQRAFSGCTSLTEIILPETLVTIDDYAFYNCTSLTEITLPGNLLTIDNYAFYGCTSLASITIPNSVTFIGLDAFPDTTDVQYPSSLSKIEDGTYKRVDTVYVTGTLNYEYAYEVLEQVNEEREAEGYEPLTMDTELLEVAMQRAAENSLYYSHTRPCGLSCKTMISSHSLGENIAAGYTTPTTVMTAWMNSSGHRANILASYYQSIGIGCFYSNGHYYWVQDFSADEATEVTQQENYTDSTETMSVMIDPDLFQDYLNLSKTSVNIDPGETTSVTATITNQGWTAYSVKLEPESFIWTSSDPSVATVDASGQITGVNPGTATITAATTTTGELYRTVDVTVIGEDLSGCTITLSDTEYTYDGTAKEPAATVTFNGKTLVQDVDYTLSYSNNTTAGTGYAVVTGIEAYSGTAEAAFTIYPVVTPDTVTVAVGETATITTAGFPGKVYAGLYSGERGVADITSDDNGQLTVTGLKAGTVTAKIYGTGCVYEDQTSIKSLVTITVTDGSSPGDTDGDGSGSGDTGSGDSGPDGSGDTGSGGSSSDDGSDAGSDGSGDEDTDPGNDDSGNTGSGDNTGTSGDTLMVRRGTTFYFNYTLKGGNADYSTNAGLSTDQVLVGDWDGDGVDTICLRRGNVCYFIDDITTMHVYLTVTYGRPGDEVLVGDWDGDGCDSLAMRRNGNYYFFCNDITNPDGDTWSATYGRAADEVHVGDWEGRGYDSLAVRRDGNYYYFSLSKVTDPNGDVWVTTFGRAGDEVLVGDWDANGTDTLAMRRNGNTYFISNSIANPDSDVDTFTFGRASDEVYAGKWK